MAIIRILAVDVGTEKTIFYKEDGSTIEMASNDPRLPRLVAEASNMVPALGYADLDFTEENQYKQVEEKSGGIIKLFRVAKKFVQHIFSEPAPIAAQTIGIVPVVPAIPEVRDAKDGGYTTSTAPVVAPVTVTKEGAAALEILSKAQSVSDVNYTNDETTNDDTIIAVVQNDKGEDVIIPGMENLKDHFAVALKLGSMEGVQNFLRRISAVIDKRGHSIDDLLRFMSKNDMPIADDGTLVAFKTLNRRGSHAAEYVDIHSGKVIQRVGSKVFMAEGMVDPNRRNECSNGLHIARRAYVGGFRGSHGVMTLVKVAPEDAIAVPQYDGNKMRVCAYHIVADVPSEDHNIVATNRPLPKDSKTAKLLGGVLKGQHIGIIELVEIGGSMGSNLKITKVGSEAQNRAATHAALEQAKKAEPVASIDDEADGAKPKLTNIDVKAAAENAAAVKATTNTIQGKARILFEAGKMEELRALKKGAKKSYTALGFTPEEEKTIVGTTPNAKTEAALKDVKAGNTIKTGTVENTMKELNTPEPKEDKKMTGTRAEVARQLWDQAVAGDKSRWRSLWHHQKECKKSWATLGFNPREIERIKLNKPDSI